MPRPALPRIIYFMPIAAGLASANIHYAQPLLPMIGASFGVSDGRAAWLPALTQIGFAGGILVLLPLAELHDRRRLIVTLLPLVALALVLQAAAPVFALACLGALLMVLVCIVPQLLPPFAAMLAPPSRAGEAGCT
jgi:predicted MFS family arabinose efflux permease